MIASSTRQLTEQFYQWEQRGRGWLRADGAIKLEASFCPFYSHHVPTPYIDDGKRSTIFSSIGDIFRSKEVTPEIPIPELPEVEFFYETRMEEYIAVGISFPKAARLEVSDMEQLYVMLSHCKHHTSFEIIATNEAIYIQLAYHPFDEDYILGQLRSFFPTYTIHEEDRLEWQDAAIAVVDFGLREEFMRPLGAGRFDHEPLTGVFGLLEHLKRDEQVIIQILFQGTVNTWSESIMNAVTDGYGGSFFFDEPDMPKLALDKISRPLFAVCVRAMAQAPKLDRAMAILTNISNGLITASGSKYNALKMLSDEEYTVNSRVLDILQRQSHRSGMLLNTRELATLAHFPSPAIASAKLKRILKTTKAAPSNTGEYLLGENTHHGIDAMVFLPDEIRLKHIHIVGSTGTGKSTLLQSLIYQDIVQNKGICVLDPHGDLIENVLAFIPENRIDDVIIIDPFDSEFPVGFNILKAHSDIEKELLSTDLVALFRRFSTSWGDQMNSVLANAIMAFVESSIGGTLIELRRFLIEKPFRDQFLTTVQDPAIVYYWQKEYPLLKSTSLGSILTRLDAFLRPKLIRNMVSQHKSLDFDQIMDNRKILLVKLSEGLIGAENSYLLGAFIVSKLQQTAMARQAKSQTSRIPFYCYIDEFHQFITSSMSAILSGGRKYGLGLILSHQSMEQVSKSDSILASSLLSNAGTRICFRLGDDAKKFSDGFASFSADDLQNLDTGEAICRIGKAEDDFSLRVLQVPTHVICNHQERIIAASREKYGTPKETLQSIMPLEISAPSIPPQPIQQSQSESLPTPPIIIKQDLSEIERKQEVRQHRYLQTLIKKMAEERGYKAEIELPTPDGNGKVDVALAKDEKRIACEISVTTTIEWELHNIRKCLVAGYDTVVWCSTNNTALRNMREQVQQEFNSSEQQNIKVFQPEELFNYLDTLNTPVQSSEKRIKGYRVNLSYESIGFEEKQQKSISVSRIVREALNRKK